MSQLRVSEFLRDECPLTADADVLVNSGLLMFSTELLFHLYEDKMTKFHHPFNISGYNRIKDPSHVSLSF